VELDGGATVPFTASNREGHRGLDDIQLRELGTTIRICVNFERPA
jgi:hypothetical protein